MALAINVTGAGQDSDINITGSTVKATNNLSLKADDEINLIAAQNTDTLTSKNKNSSASIGNLKHQRPKNNAGQGAITTVAILPRRKQLCQQQFSYVKIMTKQRVLYIHRAEATLTAA